MNNDRFGDFLMILVMIGICVSTILLMRFCSESKEIKSDIKIESEKIDSIRAQEREELREIDSLRIRVEELEGDIVNSRVEITRIDTITIKERVEIKNLPVNEGVELLRENLRKYEQEINP